jgi:hypothetical protein
MERVPVRLPPAEGLKLTLIEQLALAARFEPQLLDWVKSPLLLIPAILREALPVLLNLICCAELVDPDNWPGKLRLVGEIDTFGAGAKPSPLSETN